MSDETKIFTKNDKNGDKCASGGQESGLKLIFERGVAILVRPWRFPGQPKKFVFFSIKVGTINSGTSLDSREQFKKTGKLELYCLLREKSHMTKAITLRKLADIIGVAHSTVQRALSGHPNVRTELRTRIIQMAGELGYSLPSKHRTGNVAIIISCMDFGGYLSNLQIGRASCRERV